MGGLERYRKYHGQSVDVRGILTPITQSSVPEEIITFDALRYLSIGKMLKLALKDQDLLK
ncbi:hypothetical protein K7432_011148 [Basidiobolus ranarum]|uniref:Uncharacterized protein n=1 Tax=Basidiobolus ranarum TaxID=34480 RepID=A0ABR2VUA8_9FUNG